MAETSGSRRRIEVSKPYDQKASHQVTSSTQYHAENGDELSAAILRGMYDPAPNITGRSAPAHD